LGQRLVAVLFEVFVKGLTFRRKQRKIGKQKMIMAQKKINLSKLGTHIRAHRTNLDLTREALAKKTTVNYNTIVKLESGGNINPTIKTLLALCKVFDRTVDELLRGQ
jgi:DNA-binding XRE family transcriptional regulator